MTPLPCYNNKNKNKNKIKIHKLNLVARGPVGHDTLALRRADFDAQVGLRRLPCTRLEIRLQDTRLEFRLQGARSGFRLQGLCSGILYASGSRYVFRV